MSEIVITKESFEKEVRLSEVPVLLDFWAEWCGPCRMIAPVIAELAEERAGELKVGKINVDDQPELATSFGIESIPTIVIMKNGVITDTAVGYRSKAELEKLL